MLRQQLKPLKDLSLNRYRPPFFIYDSSFCQHLLAVRFTHPQLFGHFRMVKKKTGQQNLDFIYASILDPADFTRKDFSKNSISLFGVFQFNRETTLSHIVFVKDH